MCRQMWKYALFEDGVRYACLTLLLAMSLVSASQRLAAQAGSASAPAQPVERDTRFEVASIRPGSPPTGLEYNAGPQGYTPGRFRETNMRFSAMAGMAFGIKQNYELEYPRWMDSSFFTINATLPEGATKADLPIMFKHLLEDRFGIMFHHETRQMSGYELVVPKSGPKLTKSDGPAPDKPADNSPRAARPLGPGIEFKNGAPVFAKDARSTTVCGGPSLTCWLHGHDKTMQALAEDLAQRLRMPVMDATGLDGGYDYTITFTDEVYSGSGIVVSPLPLGGASGAAAGGDGAPVPLAHPLLRDAVREQLGLELRPVKNVAVDVVVLDSAKKEPTDN
jgi:uncharacterized protein (TIGR03435 family)